MWEHLSAGLERELAHENEALNMGLVEYRRKSQNLKEHQLETKTDYGKKLLVRSIEPLAEAIEKFLAEAETAPGRKHTAALHLSRTGLEAEMVALLTCRVVLDCISQQQKLTSTAIKIGNRIEDEVKFRHFDEEAGPLYRAVVRNLDNHPMGYQPMVRRKMLSHTMTKFKVAWIKWKQSDKLHIGLKLVDLFMESVGLVRINRLRQDGQVKLYLEPTDELNQWIVQFSARSELMSPFWLPMIHPPKPWTSPFEGGYYQRRLQRPLIKTRTVGYLDEMKFRDMPVVYEAVNALQSVPWKVNAAMLEMVCNLWDSGLEVKGMPARQDHPMPVKPADIDTNAEARQYWKMIAGDNYRENLSNASKRIQTATILWLAKRFSEEKAIWFPVQLDFRGRMYCVPQYLNPQGCDLAKSLLTFSEGKPLGTDGAFWLAVHTANSFGFDKVSLEARADWTRTNSDRIVRVANDPLSDLWWTEADKPFQFLAACIEWVGYTTDGEDYVCSLPVMVDGSCNGIQNFAAMLRDEIAGRNVNLVPQEKPADIYAEVAKHVEEVLRTDTTALGSEYAQAWLSFGIDRDMCKRPVMVLPYGGTRDAVRKYLMEFVKKKRLNPFGKTLNKALSYLSTIIWNVMAKVVIGPRKAMDWLKEISRIVSKTECPLVWGTPSGFLVQQAYPEVRSRRLKTKVGDQIIFVSLREEQERLDKRKQSQAVAPNFVHALDASALAFTIVKCRERNIHHFAAVHDSYGTLAADMAVLSATLRECFVEMYQKHDVLAEFAAEVQTLLPPEKKLPTRPPMGSLDLAGILLSTFFFA